MPRTRQKREDMLRSVEALLPLTLEAAAGGPGAGAPWRPKAQNIPWITFTRYSFKTARFVFFNII